MNEVLAEAENLGVLLELCIRGKENVEQSSEALSLATKLFDFSSSISEAEPQEAASDAVQTSLSSIAIQIHNKARNLPTKFTIQRALLKASSSFLLYAFRSKSVKAISVLVRNLAASGNELYSVFKSSADAPLCGKQAFVCCCRATNIFSLITPNLSAVLMQDEIDNMNDSMYQCHLNTAELVLNHSIDHPSDIVKPGTEQAVARQSVFRAMELVQTQAPAAKADFCDRLRTLAISLAAAYVDQTSSGTEVDNAQELSLQPLQQAAQYLQISLQTASLVPLQSHSGAAGAEPQYGEDPLTLRTVPQLNRKVQRLKVNLHLSLSWVYMRQDKPDEAAEEMNAAETGLAKIKLSQSPKGAPSEAKLGDGNMNAKSGATATEMLERQVLLGKFSMAMHASVVAWKEVLQIAEGVIRSPSVDFTTCSDLLAEMGERRAQRTGQELALSSINSEASATDEDNIDEQLANLFNVAKELFSTQSEIIDLNTVQLRALAAKVFSITTAMSEDALEATTVATELHALALCDNIISLHITGVVEMNSVECAEVESIVLSLVRLCRMTHRWTKAVDWAERAMRFAQKKPSKQDSWTGAEQSSKDNNSSNVSVSDNTQNPDLEQPDLEQPMDPSDCSNKETLLILSYACSNLGLRDRCSRGSRAKTTKERAAGYFTRSVDCAQAALNLAPTVSSLALTFRALALYKLHHTPEDRRLACFSECVQWLETQFRHLKTIPGAVEPGEECLTQCTSLLRETDAKELAPLERMLTTRWLQNEGEQMELIGQTHEAAQAQIKAMGPVEDHARALHQRSLRYMQEADRLLLQQIQASVHFDSSRKRKETDLTAVSADGEQEREQRPEALAQQERKRSRSRSSTNSDDLELSTQPQTCPSPSQTMTTTPLVQAPPPALNKKATPVIPAGPVAPALPQSALFHPDGSPPQFVTDLAGITDCTESINATLRTVLCTSQRHLLASSWSLGAKGEEVEETGEDSMRQGDIQEEKDRDAQIVSLYLRILNAGYNIAAMLASPASYPFPPETQDCADNSKQEQETQQENQQERQQAAADLFSLTADFLRNLLGFLQRGRQTEWEWADSVDMGHVLDQCSRSLLSGAALRLDLACLACPCSDSFPIDPFSLSLNTSTSESKHSIDPEELLVAEKERDRAEEREKEQLRHYAWAQMQLRAAFTSAERALLLHAPAVLSHHEGIRSALKLMVATSVRSGSSEEVEQRLPPWSVIYETAQTPAPASASMASMESKESMETDPAIFTDKDKEVRSSTEAAAYCHRTDRFSDMLLTGFDATLPQIVTRYATELLNHFSSRELLDLAEQCAYTPPLRRPQPFSLQSQSPDPQAQADYDKKFNRLLVRNAAGQRLLLGLALHKALQPAAPFCRPPFNLEKQTDDNDEAPSLTDQYDPSRWTALFALTGLPERLVLPATADANTTAKRKQRSDEQEFSLSPFSWLALLYLPHIENVSAVGVGAPNNHLLPLSALTSSTAPNSPFLPSSASEGQQEGEGEREGEIERDWAVVGTIISRLLRLCSNPASALKVVALYCALAESSANITSPDPPGHLVNPAHTDPEAADTVNMAINRKGSPEGEYKDIEEDKGKGKEKYKGLMHLGSHMQQSAEVVAAVAYNYATVLASLSDRGAQPPAGWGPEATNPNLGAKSSNPNPTHGKGGQALLRLAESLTAHSLSLLRYCGEGLKQWRDSMEMTYYQILQQQTALPLHG